MAQKAACLGEPGCCTELGMFLVSWALACSFVKLTGEHPVTGPLWGSWKSCTEEAGECIVLRGLTRWCCQGRAKGTA